MTAETIGIWVSLAGLFLAVGSGLVKLGRVLERQKVHSEHLQSHDHQIGDLADGHSETRAASEALRGEMRALQATINGLASTLRDWIDRLDRHMARE